MPELPEVESIKLQLQKYIIGHTIESIQVNWLKTFPLDKEKVIGSKIIDVRRFGKVLVVDFENGNALIIHIKMTGQLVYRGPNLKITPTLSKKIYGGVPGKHTHIIFHLDKEGILYYNDIRKFGWMKVLKSTEIKTLAILNKMGPEPLTTLSLDLFKEILKKSSRSIKVVIMDQERIAGVGNIYANDALYLSGINPIRKANSLTNIEEEKLFKAIEEVLRRGIKAGGASENTFVTPDGTEGSYQDISLVYGKKGLPCANCKTEIERIVIGGRGTFFCPKCQI